MNLNQTFLSFHISQGGWQSPDPDAAALDGTTPRRNNDRKSQYFSAPLCPGGALRRVILIKVNELLKKDIEQRALYLILENTESEYNQELAVLVLIMMNPAAPDGTPPRRINDRKSHHFSAPPCPGGALRRVILVTWFSRFSWEFYYAVIDRLVMWQCLKNNPQIIS